MGYRLEGQVLEVCTCNAVCPCWIARAPDGGECRGVMAYHFTKGTIDNIDVSGLSVAMVVHIPGVVTAGNWKALLFIDERATQDQEQALIEVLSGKAGGPVADFAQLIGEVVGVERAPIDFSLEKGKGSFSVGDKVSAEIEPLIGATGNQTVLSESAFSTIPGSPAYCAESTSFRLNAGAEHGWNFEISGKNAINGDFLFDAA